MNFELFKKQWYDVMDLDPNIDKDTDMIEVLNEYYIEYKISLKTYGDDWTVKEWCEFFFFEFNKDEHNFWLKQQI